MTLPFENDTRAIIKKIASAQLKKDKLKKGLSILAIALATFLMTVVLLLSSGIITVNMNGGNSITGTYHALISDVTQEQYTHLSKDDCIELMGVSASLGSVSTEGTNLNISYANEDGFTLNGLSVSEGQMPERVNEIIIEKDYLVNQGLELEIGDTISLPVNKEQVAQEFTISGYLKTGARGSERSLYAAFVSEKYFNKVDGWNTLSSMIMFRLASPYSSGYNEIQNTIAQVCKDAGIDQSPSINEAYIELSHPSILMIATVLVGLIIVIMAGILVIYCIFYISILNSIKEYGQLRTIGMTEKQIKRLVFREGNLLSLIAVPIGLISGILVSYLLIPHGFKVSSLIWVCPAVGILVCLTVRLSIKKPAVIAATVSPIEAYRYEINTHTIHTHNKSKKITPLFLAKGQIVRNKKKNGLTIASLVLTGILLFSASSVLSSVNARDMSLSGFSMGQFFVDIRDQELRENSLETVQKDNPFTDEIYHSLSQISGVEQITITSILPISNDLQAQESDAAIVGFNREDMDLIRSIALGNGISSYEKLESQNQLIIGRPDDAEEYFGFQPKVGESVTLKVFDGTDTTEMNFEIGAVLDQSKIGNNGNKIDMLMLASDSINKIATCNMTSQYAIKVEDSMEQQAQKEIEQILTTAPRLSVRTLSAAIAQNENFLQGITLALAVTIIFIGCFAVINLLNTILTGIIVRQKEFALMRSVGMSQKQLTKMICYEGLIIVSAGLMLSILIGCGVGYLFYGFLKNGLMTYLNYRFPIVVALSYCAVVLGCSFVIIQGALKRQRKPSLVELLKG